MGYIDVCKTKLGVITKGDILVILKKDGSRSLIKIERFRESISPSGIYRLMIDYIQLLPKISHEPLISLYDFESMAKEIKPVMNMPDQEWEEFFKFLHFSKYIRIFEEALQ